MQAEAVANGKEFTADTQYFRCRSEVSKSSQESGPLIDDLNIEIEPSVVQNYVQDTEQSSKNETEVSYIFLKSRTRGKSLLKLWVTTFLPN